MTEDMSEQATLREVSGVDDDVVIPVVGQGDDSWLNEPTVMAVLPIDEMLDLM